MATAAVRTTMCMCAAHQVMFSRPLPEFSCRLNALATAMTCQWLMGPCKVNDVEIGERAHVTGERTTCEKAVSCMGWLGSAVPAWALDWY